MTRPKRIILDVDGVICDFVEHWLYCAKQAGCTNLVDRGDRGDRGDYAWKLEDRYGATPEQKEQIARKLYTTSPNRMKAIDGAILGIRELENDGHDIYFATTSLVPNPLWEHGRREWFTRYLGSDHARRLVFIRYKHIIDGDVFVDDKKENIAEYQSRSRSNASLILFGADRPHDCRGWLHAKDWADLMGLIKFWVK